MNRPWPSILPRRAEWGPDYDDPHTYMGYWTSASTDMGVTFDNPAFDALLDKANKEPDLTRRAMILNEAEALFSDIAPCIPIMHLKVPSQFSRG